MKIIQINTTYKNGGSTGRIVYDLQNICAASGIESHVAYGYEFKVLEPLEYKKTYKICKIHEMQWSKLKTRIWPNHGFYNTHETTKLICWINNIKPDIIHLHNLHNHFLNNKLLFKYLKEQNIAIVWTLHDCWSFTGWCAYFDYANCNKWKTECHHCPSLKEYPYTWFFDRSRSNYKAKCNCFNGVKNLTLVTPSEWLGKLTRESFLKDYPVKVINNGVDTNLFYPREENNIREEYGIGNRKMILAMANGFSKRKGVEYLFELANKLTSDECLVMVGVNKAQAKTLPSKNCIGIPKTSDINKLAAIYSAADVFINPTLEDNFPTTNIEALACGTPIVTFNTGGSVESVDAQTGLVVPQKDITNMLKAVRKIIAIGKDQYIQVCRAKALELYNKEVQYGKYLELYQSILK